MEKFIFFALLVLFCCVIFFFGFSLRCQRELLYPRHNEIDGRYAWQKKGHKMAYIGLQVVSLIGITLLGLILKGEFWKISLVLGAIITLCIFGVLKKMKP